MFESSVVIAAKASAIQAVYADVERWGCWDEEVAGAWLDGPLRPGAKGWLKPRKGPRANIHVDSVDATGGFTVSSKLPLCELRFVHELHPLGDAQVRVVHRIAFTGPLAPLFRKLIGADLAKGLQVTLEGLAHYATRPTAG